MPTGAYSIAEFCHAHRLSIAFFYVLQKRGEGPTIMKVGKRCRLAKQGRDGRPEMSGLFRLPDDLRRLRALMIDLGSESDDPRFIIPLVFGELNGLQWRRVRPGGDLERPTLPIAWVVIVDDRAPGALGPTSFDAGTLQWLFADAFKIAIDAAEPEM